MPVDQFCEAHRSILKRFLLLITIIPHDRGSYPRWHSYTCTWLENAELSRRLSFPNDEWFAYATAGTAAYCWVALADDKIIAVTQLDREASEHGHLDPTVRPSLREQGIATAVLTAFCQARGAPMRAWRDTWSQDNAASLACCRRCGFEVLAKPDRDGFRRAIDRLRKTPKLHSTANVVQHVD